MLIAGRQKLVQVRPRQLLWPLRCRALQRPELVRTDKSAQLANCTCQQIAVHA